MRSCDPSSSRTAPSVCSGIEPHYAQTIDGFTSSSDQTPATNVDMLDRPMANGSHCSDDIGHHFHGSSHSRRNNFRRTSNMMSDSSPKAGFSSAVLLFLFASCTRAFTAPAPRFASSRPANSPCSYLSMSSLPLDPKGSGKRRDELPTNIDPSRPPPIRYLGRGPRAIVRPGVVLLAPKHEQSHFLMKSAVFVYAMGLNEYDEYVTRGVIIDHPVSTTWI